jgi:hypothetical protein
MRGPRAGRTLTCAAGTALMPFATSVFATTLGLSVPDSLSIAAAHV